MVKKDAEQSVDDASDRIDKATTQVEEKVSKIAEGAPKKVAVLQETAANGMRNVADVVKERAAEPQEVLRRAGNYTADYLETHSTSRVWEKVRNFARKHPGPAIACAFLAGLALGKILRSG